MVGYKFICGYLCGKLTRQCDFAPYVNAVATWIFIKMKCRLLLTCLFVIASLMPVVAKKVTTPGNIPEYIIEGAGVPDGGCDLVKVSVMDKKKNNITEDMLAKAAVHGVLFRGYSSSKNQGFGGSSDHPAVAGSPGVFDQFIDIFQPFFDGGSYMQYIRFIDDGRSVTKVGDKYRVSAIISVSTNQLKKDLSAKGVNVIRSLGSGF